MKPETEAAAKRVLHALKGLHPRNHPCTVIDAEGEHRKGLRTPLADVTTGDVQTLCLAVPLEKVCAVVKALAKGTRPWPPETPCQVQTQCLWTILRALGAGEPPAVADPDPDKPMTADEG
jgi:hypothetical protein